MSEAEAVLQAFKANLTLDPQRLKEILAKEPYNLPGITTKQIRSVLENHSDVFQANQRIERVKNYRKYQTYHVGELVQIDLMFLNSPRNTAQQIRLEGSSARYLVVAVDTFSRYLQVVPVKTKSAVEVATALASIVKHLRDLYYGGVERLYHFKLLADSGAEFSPSRIGELIKNCSLLRSKSKHGASIAERYILEIRNKVRVMKGGHSVTSLTVEELQSVVDVINNAPKTVISSQGHTAEEILTTAVTPDKLIPIHPEPDEDQGFQGYKLPLGGYCRVVNYAEKDGKIFVKKSAYNNYTSKIFSIAERSLDGVQNIPIYTIVSLEGTYISTTTWYEEELLWVPTEYVKGLNLEERDYHEDFSQEELKTYRLVLNNNVDLQH